jgi:hypothetical protein
MARKPQKPRPVEDPAEYQRFVETARALGVDESPDALDRAFDRIIRGAGQPPPQHDAQPESPVTRQQDHAANNRGASRTGKS